MALQAKLFRFKIELSDTVQSSYHSLDFRIAQHPSETEIYMLTRVLAYALSYEEDLQFSASGLSDPDAPAMTILNPYGDTKVWIEIGNPSTRKLHKASKSGALVKVFTYKNAQILLDEMEKENVHKRNEIQVYSIDSDFLEQVATHLKKDNKWSLVFVDGMIMLSSDDFTLQTELKVHF